MNKSDLVKMMKFRFKNFSMKDIDDRVVEVFNAIKYALSHGQQVEIRGFGRFFTKNRKSRVIVNPRTKQIVQVMEKNVPFFKAGKIQKVFNEK
ncbi:HU family DNA-binding protein [Candidatus Gromoviella agglomerans]|uniref:HU family DNA-binding protein n=1 Tax=Candidatus Gromoviella agglomerans TaxID=2806609 RepID=UPI001E351EE9|nr:HU family DNA-binding protein [Candidatus Gromoviella agglomerans]UFX98619.1 Integration host factor subunit beta [Candidatus Gromoviella agglomerans]